MRITIDFLMVLVTTFITIRSIRLIEKYKSNSLSDWAIFLLYIFQTLPVVFDMIIGIPQYNRWFLGFAKAMANDTVCIVYDLYLLSVNIALMIVSKRSQRNDAQECTSNLFEITKSVPNFVLFLLILSPMIHVLLSGRLSSFSTYDSFNERGLEASFTELNSVLIIISILALMIWYFRREKTIIRTMALLVFSFLIIWISGKRYSVVTILFSFLYMNALECRDPRHRINVRALLAVMGVAVIVYSVYYITVVKVTANSDFESVYTSLRIDFGRDDVVKFTIWKEYIKGEHILEYPLQTIISSIFMAVPRFMFPLKGYPHYRYLTAAIYNTNILKIPSGMTPSILEMMISNFRYFGMPLCIAFLCWYCSKADKAVTSVQHYCYAMVMVGMLTQSLDSMIVIFYMVIYFILTSEVKFAIGKTRLKKRF